LKTKFITSIKFLIALFSVSTSFPQLDLIFDFENYIPGQQLACQDSINWTTWSLAPCDPLEDPIISTNHSVTGTKSVLMKKDNDLVKLLGDRTAGIYAMSFWMYIPNEKAGYFNTLNTFPANLTEHWGMEVYFGDLTQGQGRLLSFNPATVNFTFSYNTWFMVTVMVNLDTDMARFWLDNAMIHQWQWTRGVPSIYALRLAAMDFYGPTQSIQDELYIDDYFIWDGCMACSKPNAPTNLTAQQIFLGYAKVNLIWQDNSDNEYAFNIIRKNGLPNDPGNYQAIGTTPVNITQFIDSNVVTKATYTYGVLAYNNLGYSDTSNFATITIEPVTNINETNAPLAFHLEQNSPNPFNPSTSIKYSVPESGNIRLSVFNIVGEEVAVLAEGFTQAGFYEVTFDASNLSTGVYLYKLQSANSVQTKKMMLLK